MLPVKLNWGAIALIVYALAIWGLVWLVFDPTAFAASRYGRPYRGYADVCVTGSPPRCGSLQTREVFNTLEQCERTLARGLREYENFLKTPLRGSASCRFERGTYDA